MSDLLTSGLGAAKRPMPQPTDLSAPYWEGCRSGELRYLECRTCGTVFFPPEVVCINCLSEDTVWQRSEGRGSVYTFSVIRQQVAPGFPVPSVFAIVELDEGYPMFSNIIGCRPEDVRIGMPVEVVFESWSPEISLPFFAPVTVPEP